MQISRGTLCANTFACECYQWAGSFTGCPRTPPPGGSYAATVGRVLDGDSLDFRTGGTLYRLRLAEIDAPEKGQPNGERATALLSNLTLYKSVKIHYDTCDRYGRIVGHVVVRDIAVNDAMVERSAAWFYSKYSNSAALYDLENEARDAKRGLWALPKVQTVEPWVWRKLSAAERDSIRRHRHARQERTVGISD